MKIAVVGLWHLGMVTSVSLAKLGHTVTAIDFDARALDHINQGHVPGNEPGVKELIKEYVDKKVLNFTSDPKKIKDVDVIIITHDTPVGEDDSPDTRVIFESVRKIAPYVKKDVLFVVMSQVPVGTTKKLVEVIKKINPKVSLRPVYSPENLQLGKALDCFLKPERIVIGADSVDAQKDFEKVIKDIDTRKVIMNIASAEMTKHALNAFLATSLSFTYNISDLCEAAGADVTKVMDALKSDVRIGKTAYLDTSLGFSGGTLMRDLRSLVALGKEHKQASWVIEGVLDTNVRRRGLVVERLKEYLGFLSGKKIAILGVTYKPGTSTLRRSLSVELITLLKKARAKISAYDPGAHPSEFLEETGFALSANPYEAAKDCQCLIFITPWPEFTTLDFAKLKAAMKKPYLLFDTRNVFQKDEERLKTLGFRYHGLGRGL